MESNALKVGQDHSKNSGRTAYLQRGTEKSMVVDEMFKGHEPWVFNGSRSANGSGVQRKAVSKASLVMEQETCPSNWLVKDRAEIQTPDQGSRRSPCPLCPTARRLLAMQVSSFCNTCRLLTSASQGDS